MSDPAPKPAQKSNDAEIRVVRYFFYPSQEATFRNVTRSWDFLYAMDLVQFGVESVHRTDFLALLRKWGMNARRQKTALLQTRFMFGATRN